MPLKGKNPAAFSYQLMCPRIAGDGICGGTKFKFVNEVSRFMYRYKCMKCGKNLKYDFSNNPDFINRVYGKDTRSIIDKIKNKYNLLFR
jgi:hypothetical protein